jgi:hypothetical protein
MYCYCGTYVLLCSFIVCVLVGFYGVVHFNMVILHIYMVHIIAAGDVCFSLIYT